MFPRTDIALTPFSRRTHYTVAADGTRLAWHEHDRGVHAAPARHTLLLTNGVGTSERFWRHLVDAFVEHERVVHWEYRGHGASEPARSGDYTVRTHADDLARVTADVMALASPPGPPPVHVGFSMGVTVALELYRANPGLVSGLVLLGGPADAPYANTFPLRVPGVLGAVRASMRAFAPAVPLVAPAFHAFARSDAAFALARALGVIERSAPREDIRAFCAALATMDPKAFWGSATSLMGAHASDVLETITVPALVVGAAHDVAVPRSQIEDLANRLPGASFVFLPDAGHALLIEAGPSVVAAVRSFLERTPGAALRVAGAGSSTAPGSP